MAEDRAGQEVLRAAESAEFAKRVMADRMKRSFVGVCRTEDSHEFTSYGQCSKCGAHRAPAR